MSTSRLDRAGLVERVAERTGLSARTSDKVVEAILDLYRVHIYLAIVSTALSKSCSLGVM